MSDKARMELSATQVIGGALAAASAAVAASVLGVYGTVIGAAVMSVVASVGGAIYTHSIRRGKQAIDKTKLHRTVRILRVGEEPPGGTDDRATEAVEETVEQEDDGANEVYGESGDQEDDRPTATDQLAGQEPSTTVVPRGDEAADGQDSTARQRRSWRERFAGINPKAVALTGVAVLVLSLSAVVFVESLLQQPLSSALGRDDHKGGNTISRMFDGGSSSGEDEQSPAPTSATPSPATSEPSATTSEPTSETRTSTTRPTTSKPTTRPTTSEPTTSQPTTEDPETVTEDPADGGNRRQQPADE